MIIRLATLDDAAALLPLSEQLGYPQSLQVMQKQLSLYENTPDHHVFLAEQDGAIIGFVACVMSELFVLEGKRCFIMGLVVNESCRSQGIGRALMDYVEALSKEQGCLIVDLTSGKKRAADGAHAFYHAIGYDNDGEHAKVYLRKEI